MKIQSINTLPKGIFKTNYLSKNSFVSPKVKNNSDFFIHNSFSINKNEPSFRGKPYSMPEYGRYSISGTSAFEYFEMLKLGNYLDIGGDTKNSYYREIRNKNLSFLDLVNCPDDKLKFIELYEKHTGFPNMKKVSDRIKSEFISATEKAQSALEKESYFSTPQYEVLALGYDGVSSVARNTAFPGSDLDKAYVIIKGCNNDELNEKFVNDFKAKLWKNTDQTILSYNHDVSAFPEVYTEKQINSMCDAINRAALKMKLFEPEITKKQMKLFGVIDLVKEKRGETKYSKYRELTDYCNDDYVQANLFFIDLLTQFPTSRTWEKSINTTNPSREDIYKACFIIESILHGDRLKGDDFKLSINEKVGDLINTTQIQALKKMSSFKEKYVKRRNLEYEFSFWDIDKKFDFIKSMIKASCSDNNDFPEYYTTQEESRFNTLMRKVDVGGCS